ncbi:MAG: hypothetical protein E5X34_13210 [Mesorhizobium sp.]|uniref:hypothetical protein n=1 Tax=Mesorhizobium sp. TaxID=1871066 RepID=UPI0012222312|nr:hypothetical protein [Mesorhizobium sp.]TIR24008.1 MAG: hypothetical protein E5X34_13210 [Mesorhizobium sp.]
MPKYNFHMGVTLRCYGNVEIEADSIDAALPRLTADFIGEHIDITETTRDSGQDLAIIDVSDADTGEEFDEYGGGYSLPSPYDPPTRYPDHASDTVDALVQAEAFISGFEDDTGQEGIADMLAGLRAAIQRERAKPDLLAYVRRMAQFTTPEDEFEDRKGEDGKVHDDGISYESADELLADFSDERLGDEFATFCEMIQEARRVRDAAEGRANG